MQKLSLNLLLFLMFLLTSFNANTNSYFCSYRFENKSYPIYFTRSGNQIFEKSQSGNFTHQILFEDKKILAFGSQGEYGNKTSVFGYLVNILNKITNKLNAVALYEPNSSKKQKISAIMEVSCILK